MDKCKLAKALDFENGNKQVETLKLKILKLEPNESSKSFGYELIKAIFYSSDEKNVFKK